MINFTAFPVHWVDLTSLTWSSHDIAVSNLLNPEQRRDDDALPIWAELLVSGDIFVHCGRHRALRAIARGEYQIQAHLYIKTLAIDEKKG